jgi:CheY-like chemotaxis protein
MPKEEKRVDIDSPYQNLRVSDRYIILVVDDVATNFTTVMEMLPESYEVCTAKSGMDALEILSHSFADLALLDIEMPGMSGIDLFKEMLENPDYNTIPVIFVTSDKDSDTVQSTIAMGAKDYIVKPFNGKTLLSKIQRVLAAAPEDQSLVYLRSKLKKIIDCCSRGKASAAETIVAEFPDNIYSLFVSLKLKRIVTAIHNRNPSMAIEIAEQMLKEIPPSGKASRVGRH